MVLPGETITRGADPHCSGCGKKLEFQVCSSAAGYYIGTECCAGPHSRESGYFKSRFEAEEQLKKGTWKPR